MSRAARVVQPETLDHQERGRVLEDPERELALEARPADAEPEVELQALRARIKAARGIPPEPEYRHCLDCYRRGWRAAVRSISSD